MKYSTRYFIRNHHVFNLFSLAILMYGCVASHTQHNNKPFYFFQMTDPQFGMYENNLGFTKETINFEKAIESANRLHPEFVIVCGDLVNQAGNKAQIDEYKRITSKLNSSIPLYNVVGNHDEGNIPTKESLEQYRKNFGADYYTFNSGNLYGIVLNSSLFFDPSLVPEEAAKQDSWLRTTLEKAKKLNYTNIVIFEHIPWFINQPDEKDGYFNIPNQRRKEYIDLLRSYGVKYVFAGHLHKNASGQYQNLQIVTTGPIGKPLGKDSSGFRIITVNGSKFNYPYYALDSIPSSINLIF